MTEIKITSKELKEIVKDYEFDITSDEYDDDEIKLFQAFSGISEGDRIILILYSHFQSLRKTASCLGVSYATTRKAINGIRKKIKEQLC